MIYLDNAATTKMFDDCLDAYKKYAVDCFYNPSALYAKALEPYNAMNQARKTIASALGCDMSEILFTASGSESDNIALRSTIKFKKGRVIISSVEHAAINNTALYLQSKGYELVFAPCDRCGRVIIDEFKKLLTKDTVLVSIMHVCNETGACNDIKTISELAKSMSKDIIVHSDGVQAFGKIPVNVKALGVDYYSISAHKIHGPKGIGALYINKNSHPRTFIFGGGQENNIRSATENIASIIAFEIATKKTMESLMKNYKYMRELQTLTIDMLNNLFNKEDICINTDSKNAGPHIVSIAFSKARGEGILHFMESKGIIVGTGSACSAKKSLKRVPKALNLNEKYYDGMIRLSFSYDTKKDDIVSAVNNLVLAYNEEKRLKN